jgi:hypothetical protein
MLDINLFQNNWRSLEPQITKTKARIIAIATERMGNALKNVSHGTSSFVAGLKASNVIILAHQKQINIKLNPKEISGFFIISVPYPEWDFICKHYLKQDL